MSNEIFVPAAKLMSILDEVFGNAFSHELDVLNILYARFRDELKPVQLTAVLEVIELEQGAYPPDESYSLYHDPYIPATWDGTQPQPVAVRAALKQTPAAGEVGHAIHTVVVNDNDTGGSVTVAAYTRKEGADAAVKEIKKAGGEAHFRPGTSFIPLDRPITEASELKYLFQAADEESMLTTPQAIDNQGEE